MSMLQVKNLPVELHTKLAARAKEEHTTMSALVVAMLDRELNVHPTTAWIAKVRASHVGLPPNYAIDSVRAVREARDERDAYWDEYVKERFGGAGS